MHQDMLLFLHAVNGSYSFYGTLSELSVPLSLGKNDLGATPLRAFTFCRSIHVDTLAIYICAPYVWCLCL